MARPGVYLLVIDWDPQIIVSPEWRFIAFLIMAPVMSSSRLTHSVSIRVGASTMIVVGYFRETRNN